MANEIIKVLDALCEKFGIAIDWTSDNVLPYLQELCGKYIKYEIWTSVGWIVLVAVIFIPFLVITLTSCPKASKLYWDDDEPIVWLAVIGIVGVIISGIVLFVVSAIQIYDIITCLTFPEKIIFEYVQGMLPSSN